MTTGPNSNKAQADNMANTLVARIKVLRLRLRLTCRLVCFQKVLLSVELRDEDEFYHVEGVEKINGYKSVDACFGLFIAERFMRRIFIYVQQFAGCFKAALMPRHQKSRLLLLSHCSSRKLAAAASNKCK